MLCIASVFLSYSKQVARQISALHQGSLWQKLESKWPTTPACVWSSRAWVPEVDYAGGTQVEAEVTKERRRLPYTRKVWWFPQSSRGLCPTSGRTWGRRGGLCRARLCGEASEAVPLATGLPLWRKMPAGQQENQTHCHSRVRDNSDKRATVMSQKLGAILLCVKEPQSLWDAEEERTPKCQIEFTSSKVGWRLTETSSTLYWRLLGSQTSTAQSPQPAAPDIWFSFPCLNPTLMMLSCLCVCLEFSVFWQFNACIHPFNNKCPSFLSSNTCPA